MHACIDFQIILRMFLLKNHFLPLHLIASVSYQPYVKAQLLPLFHILQMLTFGYLCTIRQYTHFYYREHVVKKKTLGTAVFLKENFTQTGKFDKEHFSTFRPLFYMYLNLNNSRGHFFVTFEK